MGLLVGRIDYNKLPKAELSEGLRGAYGIDKNINEKTIDEEVEEFYEKNMERIAKTLKVKKDAKYYMDKLLSEGKELYLISHRAYN